MRLATNQASNARLLGNNVQFVGSINDANGQPLASPGLWGVAFDNAVTGLPTAALYFAAGIAQGADGLFGRITVEPPN